MLTLNDGRSELWQWDTCRKLTVDADCSQVHFSNKIFGRSIDVDVVSGIAIIPDILLQTDKELTAWAFVGTAENGYTKISKAFKVNRRNKPADYVFTPHDQTTLCKIVQRLEELEAMQDPDAIRDAVDEYLANNPIEVEETDPTVPDWAKQPNPPSVHIPDTLPNPHKLTFTGAVTAEYDGSEPVEVKIPEGGGGGIEVTGASVGQTIVVKAVDENGKPTEWETADLPQGGGGGGGVEMRGELVATLQGDGISSEITQNFDETTLPDGLYFIHAVWGANTDGANSNMYVRLGGAGMFGGGARILNYAGRNAVHNSTCFAVIVNGHVYVTNFAVNNDLTSHITTTYAMTTRTVSLYSQTKAIVTSDTILKLYRLIG